MSEAASDNNPRNPARVRIDSSGCVHARSRNAECRACIDSCPTGALSAGVGGRPVATASACLGCGRCAPACPSEAIRVPGFPSPPTAEAAAVGAVDCWRVPEAGSPMGSLRLPCLGGLDTAQLLTLNRLAGSGGVALLDRGWCRDCPAGGDGAGGHPAAAALGHARSLLAACGVAEQGLPRLAPAPLPAKLALPAIPEAELAHRVNRRGAFRALLGLGMETGGLVERPAARQLPLRELRPGRRRPRLLAELAAAGAGESLLSAQRPQLTVTPSCIDHGACASVCPSGALRRNGEGDRSGLYFDAAACTACGLCVGNCPEAALQLAPSGGGAEVLRLTDHALGRCRDCGVAFARLKAEDRCGSCRRSQDMARSLFDSIG